MDINQKITEELGVKLWQVEAAVKLIDEGNTIPFIARYRKERRRGGINNGRRKERTGISVHRRAGKTY